MAKRKYGISTHKKSYVSKKRATYPIVSKRAKVSLGLVNRLSGFGFPSSLKAKLKYVQETSINPGAGIGYLVFTANGMYDPDITGTGHQPYGFDQFMNIYKKYTVTYSVIKAWNIFNSSLSPDRVPCYCTVALSNSSSLTFSNVNHMLESDLTGRVRQIGAYHAVAGTAMSLKEHVKKSFKPLAFFGKVKDDDDFEGTVSTNPTNQAYFTLCVAPQAGGTATQMYFRVQIEYSVTFTELNDLSQS